MNTMTAAGLSTCFLAAPAQVHWTIASYLPPRDLLTAALTFSRSKEVLREYCLAADRLPGVGATLINLAIWYKLPRCWFVNILLNLRRETVAQPMLPDLFVSVATTLPHPDNQWHSEEAERGTFFEPAVHIPDNHQFLPVNLAVRLVDQQRGRESLLLLLTHRYDDAFREALRWACLQSLPVAVSLVLRQFSRWRAPHHLLILAVYAGSQCAINQCAWALRNPSTSQLRVLQCLRLILMASNFPFAQFKATGCPLPNPNALHIILDRRAPKGGDENGTGNEFPRTHWPPDNALFRMFAENCNLAAESRGGSVMGMAFQAALPRSQIDELFALGTPVTKHDIDALVASEHAPLALKLAMLSRYSEAPVKQWRGGLWNAVLDCTNPAQGRKMLAVIENMRFETGIDWPATTNDRRKHQVYAVFRAVDEHSTPYDGIDKLGRDAYHQRCLMLRHFVRSAVKCGADLRLTSYARRRPLGMTPVRLAKLRNDRIMITLLDGGGISWLTGLSVIEQMMAKVSLGYGEKSRPGSSE